MCAQSLEVGTQLQNVCTLYQEIEDKHYNSLTVPKNYRLYIYTLYFPNKTNDSLPVIFYLRYKLLSFINQSNATIVQGIINITIYIIPCFIQLKYIDRDSKHSN